MQSFSAFVFIACIALASAGMSDEEITMIMQLSAECIEQTGVAQELVMKAKDGVFESDAKLSEYSFCMLKTFGFMDDAGDYQIEAMKTMLGQKFGENVASKAVDECTVFQGEKLEKALKLAECLYNKRPAK